ncbi:MAG: ribulose-phosphate 3-epimerase [bacterium]|uniref:Ribulose-phosphate 3-epimerase n=2 Tax=Bacteria candidate phyla TaxID=1783234 RepID=A0A101I130_UNCT6|nr:MAG: Ribulose-phosphate 3-epimerase [candidate division TA06 bacterium 32_111]KUK86693.1 MAG: Ribulose-phosphate 3-epimerase [candidate division TA06 bacterium 34_109]MDI6700193.1 ribulose-phosphate 3-epimerase [bacterium]HAF08372.1 ribulose-phosphate 3-epimerase [candidate division WOR-3 bacterium]HCP17407.1 ribulose-phosphate 3-epimerase [candidate division WOR-3 bacterium]
MEKDIQIIPSLLSIDIKNLKKSISSIPSYIKILHLDVMDGHFVDNITFGPHFVKVVRELTSRELDCHLMIEEPDRYYDRFIDAGATHISFHIETTKDTFSLIKKIKKRKVKVGIVLNPETEVDRIVPYLDHIDYVLVMSVHPGFAGQKFLNYTLRKVKRLKDLRGKREYFIQIDGGINDKTGKKAIKAGAQWLVSGSYIFKGDIKKNVERILNG